MTPERLSELRLLAEHHAGLKEALAALEEKERRVAELEVALESMRAGARCFMEALKVFGPGARASWSVGPAEKGEEEP
jgi:hypothetical protein